MSSAADLYGIRLKMEEKRKRIEAEKRQAELMANRQREKVGKAAFLQVECERERERSSTVQPAVPSRLTDLHAAV